LLLSPIIPTTLSLRALEQLKKFIAENDLVNLTLIPFFSMVDRRKKMHKDIMQNLFEKHPEILTTAIPYASDIERMGPERMPLGNYIKKGPSVVAYNELWQEILVRIAIVKPLRSPT